MRERSTRFHKTEFTRQATSMGLLTIRTAPHGSLAALLTAVLLCWSCTGCNYIVALGYIIGGPPRIEPLFDKETKESMTDKDVRVAVVCFAPTEIKYSFESIDNDLTLYVTNQLWAHKIAAVPADDVKAWLDQHKDWDKPEEIGNDLKVKYVIYIDLNKFSLYEEGSANLYRGHSECIVSVYKMNEEDGQGERIFSTEKTSKYPLYQAVDSNEKSYGMFKREYLTRLSDEIGRLFYDYEISDEIGGSG